MNSLHDILIRFRTQKWVYTTDVQKMFLKIHVPEESQKYLRIFFRLEDGRIVLIQWERHIFGLKSSPFVAIQTVRQQAERTQESHPYGAEAVIRDICVDDVLHGRKSQKELIRTHKEVEAKLTYLRIT